MVRLLIEGLRSVQVIRHSSVIRFLQGFQSETENESPRFSRHLFGHYYMVPGSPRCLNSMATEGSEKGSTNLENRKEVLGLSLDRHLMLDIQHLALDQERYVNEMIRRSRQGSDTDFTVNNATFYETSSGE